MKPFHNKNKGPFRLKDILLRYFLVISIICSVFLVSNCDNLFGPRENANLPSQPPDITSGEESSSFSITDVFSSVADGAEGEIGSQATGWILSSVGISNGAPDYTGQLNKIASVLETISGQLSTITTELNSIDNDIKQLDCDSWISQYTTGTGQINKLMGEYRTYVNTVATDTQYVLDATIQSWADKVLNGTANTSDILTYLENMEASLVDVNGTGTIPSCLNTLTPPVDHTFGTDTIYYHQVYSLINYFYLYQVEALYLYTEAEHYEALNAYRKYDSTTVISADSASVICKNGNIAIFCNLVASETNNLYNNLIMQFTAAGAPFSNDSILAEYRDPTTSGPFLWPRSLEDFTAAAGNNCATPLTSNAPCGVTANFYDQGSSSLSSVKYDGYTGWGKAGTAALQQLMYGWYTGTAGNYLEQRYGFKNMKNKIIMSGDMETISLNETDVNQDVVPFIDTDFNYNWFSSVPGEPVYYEFQFHAGVLTKSRDPNYGLCDNGAHSIVKVTYNRNHNTPTDRNGFYYAAGSGEVCNGSPEGSDSFVFTTWPGWLASQNDTPNRNTSAKQYQWPVLPVGHTPCTDGRSHFNIKGVWSKCGNDFTYFFNKNVPRPATCANNSAGTHCTTL